MAKIELWFPTIIYSEEDLFSNSTNERWANSLFEIEHTLLTLHTSLLLITPLIV